jgi:uncharacterized OsmC-like protein
VTARSFTLIIDEPPALGGTDAGPNPVEYLLAALAGCLNVVGHMVARELGFTLRSIVLEAGGPLNPGRFLNLPSKDRAGFKSIRVVLRADADADRETLERWLGIVKSRCPVSDNLGEATPLQIELGS